MHRLQKHIVVLLSKDTAWISFLHLLEPSGSTGYPRGDNSTYVICTTGMTSDITTIYGHQMGKFCEGLIVARLLVLSVFAKIKL